MTAAVSDLRAAAFQIPSEQPESDGTLEWDSTTILVVTARAEDEWGLGYAYTHASAVGLVTDKLAPAVVGRDVTGVRGSWLALHHAVRNLGSRGIASSAISAVDAALWDLDARMSGSSLVQALRPARSQIPAYASGGFTSYTIPQLQKQLAGWAEAGMKAVKMKVGRDPDSDLERVAAAREAIGPGVDLMVDGNGAYTRKQALWFADRFAEQDVAWFEEPVSSDDLAGLRLLRDRAPAGMEIAAGEYGFGEFKLHRLLEAEAVDVLQVDGGRCGGPTAFLATDGPGWSHAIDISAHTAPTLHAPLMCAIRRARNVEYFHDHVRIETMLFDGAIEAEGGTLTPDPDRPGLGIELKDADAEEFRVA